MRIPYRKPGKFASATPDPIMTEEKLQELVTEKARLLAIRPVAAAEVARLAELGDFSENAEYQMAKGKLCGINASLTRLEYRINNAEVITKSGHADMVQVGSKVTVDSLGKQKIFTILGSAESKPEAGIISLHSPLGSALLDKAVGDEVTMQVGDTKVTYTIVHIE